MNPFPLPDGRLFFVSSKPQPYVIAFNLSSGSALDGINSFRVARSKQFFNFLRRRNNRPLKSPSREAAVTNASCCRLECQLPCFRRMGIIDGIFRLSTPQSKKVFNPSKSRPRAIVSPKISTSNQLFLLRAFRERTLCIDFQIASVVSINFITNID